MSKLKILFAAANPSDATRLALDKEHREITANVRAASHRDAIDVVYAGALRPRDLLERLNDERP